MYMYIITVIILPAFRAASQFSHKLTNDNDNDVYNLLCIKYKY